ncbi:MAG TPA: type I restriction endonuclease [Candidatus Rifleibacterium sp.]|nr:type I restriction endonuclease [Candidatus Rifleibacterium sp.]HPT47673.1 type I restriction endonuclease [Candidatus Rifleibacterium sp.]
MAIITEAQIEELFLNELRELGYGYIHGGSAMPDGEYMSSDSQGVVFKEMLKAAIARINPNVSADGQEDAFRKVLKTNSPNLIQNNYDFHRYLTEGVDVEFRVGDRIAGDKVWLIDYHNPESNEFFAVNQLEILENNVIKIPDIIIYINGLPLIVVELKNAADENANIKTAFTQLQNYKKAIPSLFHYNCLMIASDGWEAIYGSLTAPKQFFLSWKSVDGNATADPNVPQMETMIKGMLSKKTLPDLIRHFTVFHKNKDELTKIIARYHQCYAVNKAVEKTRMAQR